MGFEVVWKTATLLELLSKYSLDFAMCTDKQLLFRQYYPAIFGHASSGNTYWLGHHHFKLILDHILVLMFVLYFI